jgi:hypothetical protein
MSGFDDNAQRSFMLPGGGRGESGIIDFSQGSYCSAVPTRMLSVYAYNAIPAFDLTTAGYQNQFANKITCDMSVSSNGTICFRREYMRTDLSSSAFYELKGW